MRKLHVFIFKPTEVVETHASKDVAPTMFEYREINDELSEFYKIIGCDCIDIVSRDVGDRTYKVIVDDEALLKENPQISFYDMEDQDYVLFGNLIFCGNDVEDGNLTSITQEDAEYLSKHITLCVRNRYTGDPINKSIFTVIKAND